MLVNVVNDVRYFVVCDISIVICQVDVVVVDIKLLSIKIVVVNRIVDFYVIERVFFVFIGVVFVSQEDGCVNVLVLEVGIVVGIICFDVCVYVFVLN